MPEVEITLCGIASHIHRNPLWQSRHLRPNRPSNWQGQKRPPGRQRAAPCGGLRRLSLSPRGQCRRAAGAGLGGAGRFAAR